MDEVIPTLRAVDDLTSRGYWAVGFVGYEAAVAFDPALETHAPGYLPLCQFGIFENPAIESSPEFDSSGENLKITSRNLDRIGYEAGFNRIKSWLSSGDVYQVNYTHQLTLDLLVDPEQVFNILVRAQPSPYATFIETRDLAICSVSPELFFALQDKVITTEPMKGTRPRGRFPAEDEQLKNQLLESVKERAENLMIVDMLRNDLAKVAVTGSVQVESLFDVTRFPTVWQQSSKITARTDSNLVDIFTALFPCASVIGAPKVRAMEIIKQLENAPRGIYTGAVGIVRPGRCATFNVAIRTLTLDKKRDQASYGIGGGIVWDSRPDDEWLECQVKARVLTSVSADFELFETMRFDPAQGFARVDYHLARLLGSVGYFNFMVSEAQIRQCLETYSAETVQRVRLSVSRPGEIRIETAELPETSGAVSLKLAASPVHRDNLFLFHKTSRRQHYDVALAGRDVDDVIFWNEQEELTETSIYNLYLQLEGRLYTPVQTSGLLAGTYRQLMLDQGRVEERVLHVADIARAERIFVSNSLRGLREGVYER